MVDSDRLPVNFSEETALSCGLAVRTGPCKVMSSDVNTTALSSTIAPATTSIRIYNVVWSSDEDR